MEQQTEQKDWIAEEVENTKPTKEFEEKPSLQLKPNVIADIEIDFTVPFEVWTGEQGGKTITKKIVPLTYEKVKLNWWLNVRNPIYREIMLLAKEGQTIFKILQTGEKANTRYVLVK